MSGYKDPLIDFMIGEVTDVNLLPDWLSEVPHYDHEHLVYSILDAIHIFIMRGDIVTDDYMLAFRIRHNVAMIFHHCGVKKHSGNIDQVRAWSARIRGSHGHCLRNVDFINVLTTYDYLAFGTVYGIRG